MVRDGRREDLDKVYRLICEMENQELEYKVFSFIYRKYIDDEGLHVFVFETQGKVLGCLNLRIEYQLHKAGKVAEIMELAVCPEHRSKGIGKALIEAAYQYAEAENCCTIEVASNRIRKRAHLFYQREGMADTHIKLTKKLIK